MDEIMRRRSTRRFQSRAVEPERTERLLRAAMQSPTGRNAQDWEFLVVTDAEKRLAVSGMSEFAVCAKNAPELIVVLANLDRAVSQSPMLWSCDMGAACQTILLQAEHDGLGAVWLAAWPHGERVDYLRRLFALPENIVPYAVIAVGYKLAEKPPEDRWDSEKVHWEKY